MAAPEDEEEKKEEPKIEEVKEEEEEKKEPKTMEENTKEVLEKLQGKGQKKIDLNAIDEGEKGESKFEEGDRQLLQGFQRANVKFHLLSGDLKGLKTKSKFRGLFDIGVLSINSENYISPEVTELFKHQAVVHCESADFIIIMNPEQRVEYRAKVMEIAKAAGWKLSDEEAPYTHHMLFEVQNPQALEEKATTATGDDSDDFDLSNL